MDLDQGTAWIKKSKTRSGERWIFIFDNDNRLQGIEIRDKTSDKKIVKLESKTPTPGDTVTIVDQLFSNLRRKNLD